MLDKDQLPILKAIIKASYGNVLMRVLAHSIMVALDEIIRSMRITSKRQLTVMERIQLIDSQIRTTQVRNALLISLDALKRDRESIVNEVIRQYGLKVPHDEIDFYQDEMQELLKGYENEIEVWIWNGDYDAIRHQLTLAPNDIPAQLH